MVYNPRRNSIKKGTIKMKEGNTLVALATLFAEGGATVRGKIPVPLVKALKAKSGDMLAFVRQDDGSILVRKSTAPERKEAWRKSSSGVRTS
jgi:hypothetical protein